MDEQSKTEQKTEDKRNYLDNILQIMKTHWPRNRTVRIACHGHSVPAGYFATPMVDTFNAYPHLLHLRLKARFPYAVINVIVTAVGGENSSAGAARFTDDVLCLKPDVVTIDYGLNDRRIGTAVAEENLGRMIREAREVGAKIILLTPTMDISRYEAAHNESWDLLYRQAEMIRSLAAAERVGLADSFAAFERYIGTPGHELTNLLSWSNHPNREGHEIVAGELLQWFPT